MLYSTQKKTIAKNGYVSSLQTPAEYHSVCVWGVFRGSAGEFLLLFAAINYMAFVLISTEPSLPFAKLAWRRAHFS